MATSQSVSILSFRVIHPNSIVSIELLPALKHPWKNNLKQGFPAISQPGQLTDALIQVLLYAVNNTLDVSPTKCLNTCGIRKPDLGSSSQSDAQSSLSCVTPTLNTRPCQSNGFTHCCKGIHAFSRSCCDQATYPDAQAPDSVMLWPGRSSSLTSCLQQKSLNAVSQALSGPQQPC